MHREGNGHSRQREEHEQKERHTSAPGIKWLGGFGGRNRVMGHWNRSREMQVGLCLGGLERHPEFTHKQHSPSPSLPQMQYWGVWEKSL